MAAATALRGEGCREGGTADGRLVMRRSGWMCVAAWVRLLPCAGRVIAGCCACVAACVCCLACRMRFPAESPHTYTPFQTG